MAAMEAKKEAEAMAAAREAVDKVAGRAEGKAVKVEAMAAVAMAVAARASACGCTPDAVNLEQNRIHSKRTCSAQHQRQIQSE